MKLLLAASEAVPFCKTGGLADVVGALARLLAGRGHEVRLFLPAYRQVEQGGHALAPVPGSYRVQVGGEAVEASLASSSWGGATVYCVRCPRYFSRPGLYQEGGRDYEDNDERFVFFSRAVLEGARFVDFRPDALHCHDWQTALIPAYLRAPRRPDAFYARAGSVLTVHNFAYQGAFPKEALPLAGFDWSDFTPERLEYYGGLNFLKAGLVFADRLSTVSPGYAREVQSSTEFGRGLEGVLRRRAGRLSGILNGIDTELWDPARDPHLPRRYGPDQAAEGKKADKKALRRECGLAESSGPLVGIVSRLDPQKGLDVVLELAPWLLERGAQLAALGTGDPALERGFRELARGRPESAHFRSGFDEPFARRIYAACDLFLMPSRFEPCGLGQMIAMRYGALPVVTRTGGLADTVREAASESGGNGFTAARCEAGELRGALERALEAWAAPREWARLRANAMAFDCSWERSIGLYERLYGQAREEAAAA